MAAAAAMVEVERDPSAVRAAKILISLRFRELRERPDWAPAPATATATREASETAAAPVGVPEGWGRRRPRSSRRRPGSFLPWMKALQELELAGSGGEAVDAAAASSGAAAGSGSPSTSSAERAQPRPGDKAAAAAAVAKEPMKASSPDTPLDYGAGGSGASSSADDAARPPLKRSPPGARGSGGATSSADDDEGCSSPAKRPRVAAAEEKPIPTERRTHCGCYISITPTFDSCILQMLPVMDFCYNLAIFPFPHLLSMNSNQLLICFLLLIGILGFVQEQSMQSETSASSAKGIAFDLNLPPPVDGTCPMPSNQGPEDFCC